MNVSPVNFPKSQGSADALSQFLIPVPSPSQATQDKWVQPGAHVITLHIPTSFMTGTDFDPSRLLTDRPLITSIDEQPSLRNRVLPLIADLMIVDANAPFVSSEVSKERARLLAAHQVNLIMDARDFRGALDALLTFERFSLYDLQHVLDATRPTFFQWRKAPVKKLRKDNASRLRLLFGTWKQWLFVGDGAPLGQWIHAPTSEGSLASILRSPGSTMTTIESAIDELLPLAKRADDTQLHYRRFVAGLPQTVSNHDYNVEMAM